MDGRSTTQRRSNNYLGGSELTKSANLDIDERALPNRCLADTGVLIRALGFCDDENTPICRAFYEAVLKSTVDKVILLAAPVLAEMLRSDSSRQMPTTPRMVPVAFDSHAAQICARELPMSILKRAENLPLVYLKYDAMIVACAKRWGAECIVTLDSRHHQQLAAQTSIPVRHPAEFLRTQQVITFPPASPPASQPGDQS